MAYSPPRTWRYRVFTSFHGVDIRKTFLSHLRKQFNYNGISMFNDQGIKKGQTIGPDLTQAIGESRISIVVLSKNYASSSWCLNELVEIFKCKEDMGQIVMTIFYEVNPSDVRKQTGDFGRVFNETCALKTEDERRRWSQALKDVGEIAGEHFLNWNNEADMIEKIAEDVSNQLNATISRDFQDMVGIEAHLKKMQSLLRLEYEDEAIIVGICGPAGIGAIPERLCDQKVLIILDDVDDLKQLEALANETNWFGCGSRIIVITEDQELLEQHDINNNNTYHVDFPTNEEARKIFCRFAFKQSFAPYGFEKFVQRVMKFCSNLPLGLRVMGSSLRRKSKDDWEGILHRLENSPHRDIEGVLRVGYASLHKDDQLLFLLIACFFNYRDDGLLKAMLDDSNLDVRLGLKNLAYKSLIQKSTEGKIVMHSLLQQVGKAIQTQDSGKRQLLIDTNEICDALETDSGSGSVIGISFDISTIPNVVYISARAFKRMRNLRYLKVYETRHDTNVRVDVPDDMEFPPRLKLLHWEVYPGTCLPCTFRPEYLVELKLGDNKLEKLWEGIQPLTNLKKIDLVLSMNLKELPDLSNATNLEELALSGCSSLVEIPSSIGNLHKLEWLRMDYCTNLQIVSTHFSLASLVRVEMVGCWQLKKIPHFSTNITKLTIPDTMLEDLLESVRFWSRLQILHIFGSANPHQVLEEYYLQRIGVDIERISDCIKDLHLLEELYIFDCPKLASLPELPHSLRILKVSNCESLETVTSFSIGSSVVSLFFWNCFELCQEARRVITQQSLGAFIPGRNIPAEFDHRAIGNSLTIPSETFQFRICVVISPKQKMLEFVDLLCLQRKNGLFIWEITLQENIPILQTEHLYICHFSSVNRLDSEILLEFSSTSQDIDITECGVQILTDQTNL